ncbi:MAG: hypothetical protein JOZ44_09150 [Acidobacteria bacterium]|nr:hypothetical protein [Acidobacteriota bacterium]
MRRVLFLSALLAGFAFTTAAAVPVHGQSAYAQPQGWHGVLSAGDQAQFDGYFSKWMEATRRSDQEDISENARKMQDIMTRYNIPTSVPFDQIASGAPAAYPNPAYAPAASWQGRLSGDDQKEFDKSYSKWMNATRKGDQDDVSSSARKMQEIMARYNIPPNVPFSSVASGGSVAAYPAPATYPSAQMPRLSGDDQKNFDKAFKDWVKARHKNHREDIDENARKMQDIMARYNIPANVPFEQIASPNAAYR